LTIAGRKDIIGEIKSIDSTNNIPEVCSRHDRQLGLYLWMARKLGLKSIDLETALKIYMGKTRSSSPIAIEPLTYPQLFIESVEGQLKELKKYARKAIMPKRSCSVDISPMAKKCKMVKTCFQLGG
jgi:hypothetical protein